MTGLSKTLKFDLPDGYPPGSWVGVDLDGTLANTSPKWCRKPPFPIGPPIQVMLERVFALRERIEVRCFTARAGIEEQYNMTRKWLDEWGLQGMVITDKKDFNMLFYMDDRALTILNNTGSPPKCLSCGHVLDFGIDGIP